MRIENYKKYIRENGNGRIKVKKGEDGLIP